MNKVLIVIIVILIGGNILSITELNKVKRINDNTTILLKEAKHEIAIKQDALIQSIERFERSESLADTYKYEYIKACAKIVELTGKPTSIIDLN